MVIIYLLQLPYQYVPLFDLILKSHPVSRLIRWLLCGSKIKDPVAPIIIAILLPGDEGDGLLALSSQPPMTFLMVKNLTSHSTRQNEEAVVVTIILMILACFTGATA